MIDQLQRPLHLLELRPNRKVGLIVIVRHQVANESAKITRRAGRVLISRPTSYTESETFSILFPRYFAYLVRDERGFPPDRNAVSEGRFFVTYRESSLLRFIEATAFSDDIRPHPLYHYGIYCSSDLVDVVSPDHPQISCLGLTNK